MAAGQEEALLVLVNFLQLQRHVPLRCRAGRRQHGGTAARPYEPDVGLWVPAWRGVVGCTAVRRMQRKVQGRLRLPRRHKGAAA